MCNPCYDFIHPQNTLRMKRDTVLMVLTLQRTGDQTKVMASGHDKHCKANKMGGNVRSGGWSLRGLPDRSSQPCRRPGYGRAFLVHDRSPEARGAVGWRKSKEGRGLENGEQGPHPGDEGRGVPAQG